MVMFLLIVGCFIASSSLSFKVHYLTRPPLGRFFFVCSKTKAQFKEKTRECKKIFGNLIAKTQQNKVLAFSTERKEWTPQKRKTRKKSV
jgi:hypothetical protein